MAQLIVRDLEDDVVRELKRRAAEHGHSAEEEHRQILRAALMTPRTKKSLLQFLDEMPVDLPDEVLERSADPGREVDF